MIGLVLVLLAGCFGTDQLSWMTDARTLRGCLLALVIFLTTLPIETRVVKSTLRRPAAPLLGTLINFGVLPLFGWGLAQLLTDDWKLGFLVTAATPCTVASAAVWTRKAGGNDVVALMVTIITNLSCFVVTPVWLRVMTGQQVAKGGEGLSPIAMIVKLGLLVLVPMIVAQSLRQNKKVAEFAATHRKKLSITTQIGLLCIVLFGAVHCGLKLREIDWGQSNLLAQFGWMLALCVVLHSVCLFIGQNVGRIMGLERADWIAVGFAGSQKTLAVGLQVGLMVGGGLVILPMVAYHFLQLFIDTLVANRMGD